jgi:hypothetical protein
MRGEQHTKRRIALRGGLEDDYLSGWSRYIGHKPGTRKSAKAKYNRRFRRLAKVSMSMRSCGGECHLCEATTCEVRSCVAWWDEEEPYDGWND